MKKSNNNNNNLPKGWRKVKLGEIIEKVIDNRGKTPPLSKSGYPLIEVFALSRERRYPDITNHQKQKFVSEKTYNSWFRAGHPKEGDILVSTVGTIAQWNLVPANAKYAIAQNIVALRPAKEKTSSEFLFYYFRQNKFVKQVEGIVIGATQPSVKLPHLLDLEIVLPPLDEQKRIADILSAFDDKIEVNNKIIKTLEEMAQEIFKEWFVRFRFSGWQKVKFVDSELGKIPEGVGSEKIGRYFVFRIWEGINCTQ
jgi:type I restriction enzyme S subunit